MADVLELVRRGGTETDLFACGRCGIVFAPTRFVDKDPEALERARELAEKCCNHECSRCGGPWKYAGVCVSCQQRENQAKEAAALAAAPGIPEESYTGMLYWEEYGHNDGFAQTFEEILEFCETEGVAIPDRVWACDSVALSLDADEVVENALECGQHHDDARDYISDEKMEELRQFLDSWASSVEVVSWFKGDKAVVRATEPEELE